MHISPDFLFTLRDKILAKLRQSAYMVAGDAEKDFHSAFHAAALETVLQHGNAPVVSIDSGKASAAPPAPIASGKVAAGSAAAKERGAKAAKTRRRNALARTEDKANGAPVGDTTSPQGDASILKRIEDVAGAEGGQ